MYYKSFQKILSIVFMFVYFNKYYFFLKIKKDTYSHLFKTKTSSIKYLID